MTGSQREDAERGVGDDGEGRQGPVEITIVVPVHDRWSELEECLQSLLQQEDPPRFEVVVVDDGSRLDPPRSLVGSHELLQLRLVHQEAMGIGAARNAGIHAARGLLIVFVDSDCLVQPGALRTMWDAAQVFSDDISFQAKLVGWAGDVVGQMEGLRLEATQEVKRRTDGHTTYLNTSGFALRASFVAGRRTVFDEEVRRGEDSLLLADLLRKDVMPRQVEAATVIHRPRLSLARYVTKHFAIGYHTGLARAELAQHESVLLHGRSRGSVLSGMWRRARSRAGGRGVLLLVLLAFAFEVAGRLSYAVRTRTQ